MAEPSPTTPKEAVFFDVDGTLQRTNIVHYYVYFRRRLMSPMWHKLWSIVYLFKCVYFLLLDRVDRARFNVVFYRGYAGMSGSMVKAWAADCYRDVMAPRGFPACMECVAEHRRAGREIVLVTGTIDFIVAPLARTMGVTSVLAPRLVERDGRFTGALDGPPLSDQEKARRVQRFAAEHDIDLTRSHAYGDSIADLPMLETVGLPHVVNPDRALAKTARLRGWSIHQWVVGRAN